MYGGANRLQPYLSRAATAFYNIVSAMATLSILLMMINIVANAIGRAWFNTPIDNTNEHVSFWYMPALALTGFILAERLEEHTEARVLFDRFPKQNQREVAFLGRVATITLMLCFGWFGLQEAIDSQSIDLKGGVGNVTIWPVKYLVPFSYFVMSLQIAVRTALSYATRTVGSDNARHDDLENEGAA